MTITLVWAQSRNAILGAKGVLPWRLPEDLAHFRELTAGGAVIMGRKTWESLPERFRPLPGRVNIVLTRAGDWNPAGAVIVSSVDRAFAAAGKRDVWVIGGLQVFGQAFDHADALEVTEINADFEGDTPAPTIPDGWVVRHADPKSGWHSSADGLDYRFLRYTRSTSAG